MKSFYTLLLLLISSHLLSQCIDESLIDPTAICPGIYAPVCGCDGISYSNSCEAQYYGGVTQWTDGECPENLPCTDLSDIDFGLCAMPLGIAFFNGSCALLSGCGYIINGVNYSPYFYESVEECQNNCVLQVTEPCFDVAGIDFGMCDMVLGVAVVNGTCQTVSGCGYISGGVDYSEVFYDSVDDCEASCIQQETEPCFDVEGIDFGVCNMILGAAVVNGTCQTIGGCGYISGGVDYSPVFFNSVQDCILSCADLQQCINEYQLYMGAAVFCTDMESPVCGCDSVTYGNSCYAYYFGGVTTYSNGPCSETSQSCQAIPSFVHFGDCEAILGYAYLENGCALVSGCSYTADNGYDYSELFFETENDCLAYCPADSSQTECIDESIINPDASCFTIYEPVCGCDSVTYSNSCVAYNFFGVTSWTDGECPTSSISNMHEQEAIRIYPNPVKDILTVVRSGRQPQSIIIYDLAGRVIMNIDDQNTSTNSIVLSMLAPGIYILESTDRSMTSVQIVFTKE